MSPTLTQRLREAARVYDAMADDASLCSAIEAVATLASDALGEGHKIIFCGNGGSAADSQHLAAELVGRFDLERPALPALAITTDTSALTAIANDYGYEDLFSRQIQALGRSGDLFVAITTSGRSRNVLKALSTARSMDLHTVALTGREGIAPEYADSCDFCLRVPSAVTARIQEGHILIGHVLCEIIEARLFPGAAGDG